MGLLFTLSRDYFFPFLIFTIMVMSFFIPASIRPKQKDYEEMNLAYSEQENKGGLDGTLDGLFWFVQVSDIHISKFDPSYASTLENVCTNYIQSIKPDFVIVSGDITDAKESAKYPNRNQQNEEEWKQYKSILQNCGVYNSSFWFDIRGNHDSSTVLAKNAANNFFYDYSPQSTFLNSNGKPSVYSFIHHTSFGNYQFVALDLSIYPLVSGPLGFFAFLDSEKLDQLESNFDLNKNYYQLNQSIIFTHSPVAAIQKQSTKSSSGKTFKNLIQENRVLAVLDGHFHYSDMYSRLYSKKDTIFDLELNSLQNDGIIRIFAMDNDLFSFQDSSTSNKDEPIIVITNPKDSRFISQKEPLYKIKESTHIRVLIFHSSTFNPSKISSVSCEIDGKSISSNMQRVDPNKPLFVAPWNPSSYSHGKHEINVAIWDSNGNKISSQKNEFSVDKTPSFLGINLYQIVQRTNLYDFLLYWDIILIIFYLLQFGILARLIKKMIQKKQKGFETFSQKFGKKSKKMRFLHFFPYSYQSMIWKFGMIPKKKWIAILISGLLFIFGPNIAEMTQGRWGAAFFFGVGFNNSIHMYSSMLWYTMLGITGVFLPTLIFASLPVIEPPKSDNFRLRLLFHPETFVALIGTVGFMFYFSFDLWSGYYLSSVFLSFGLFWPSFICFWIIIVTIVQDYRKIDHLKTTFSIFEISNDNAQVNDPDIEMNEQNENQNQNQNENQNQKQNQNENENENEYQNQYQIQFQNQKDQKNLQYKNLLNNLDEN
ncbi:helicase related [Anaeramoeba ignava]|uniref:Helicase related n=1 Tax=Anaeramoeba ignava TaxID=1746090 RepID=A0A9Q0R6W1_ANAIG|nr:helicase related [Anaeramoeba ignava]